MLRLISPFLATSMCLGAVGCFDGGKLGFGSDPEPQSEPDFTSEHFGGAGSIAPEVPLPFGLPIQGEAPIIASSPPAPTEGGTLVLGADGLAVVADPDRHRVLLVNLQDGSVREVMLAQGAQPGRPLIDGDGQVHLLLRRSGEVLRVDPKLGAVTGRTPVCSMPRGLALDATRGRLLVACGGGELVGVDLGATPEMAAGEPVMVRRDLRDVVVNGERIFVSTFKRAEMLELDADGKVLVLTAPAPQQGPFDAPELGIFGREQFMEPSVAWRMVATPNGGVAMVHQLAQVDPIQLSEAEAVDCFDCGGAGEDGSGALPPPPIAGAAGGDPGQGGGYGGGMGAGCNSIVQGTVTYMDAGGSPNSLPPMVGMVLPVDVAVSPDGMRTAVAVAGSSVNGLVSQLAGGLAGVIVTEGQGPAQTGCLMPGVTAPGAILGTGRAVGVAFDPQGAVVVHQRAPAELHIYETTSGCLGPCRPTRVISLGGEPMLDTGHDLFHLDAGQGVACASCHPGGGDDGRAWDFAELGLRRTQLFNMGLKGTEPLHWDGEFSEFGQLVDEVFVRRMGGIPQSPERVAALADWIETLRPQPALRAASDVAALRGKSLFESAEVGCNGCHNGDKLTDNRSVDVGTGGVFQVPSLVGVAHHFPYLHDGCADQLRDRFDLSCGGEQHGNVSGLQEAQLYDLVAYLETL